MNANEQTIARFYTAFARLDPDAMAPCYADDVAFDDEVFSLRGKALVMGMWRMLCTGTKERGADVWRRCESKRLHRLRALGRALPLHRDRAPGGQQHRRAVRVRARRPHRAAS
jgi:hypothetical protein